MEKLLQDLIIEMKELRKENKEIKLQNQQLMQEITELKKQQQAEFKKALEEAISHQVARLIEEKLDNIIKKLESLGENDVIISKNQKGIVELLLEIKKELTSYVKDLKAKDSEILKQGEKILEVLDDIGQAVVNTNKNVLDSNERWGDMVMNGIVKLGQGIAGLRERIDNSTRYLQQNNEHTLNAVKRVEETIIRKSW